ncbi:MAG: hypothetical protein ILP07_00945 [Treponema sp.]|jgi:hypothetical protein|nr:hypothetical protein [Treponema sp.]MBQ5400254.1 hypothetical protein [Treponema sp.]MEE3313920.1 hypothetical protein [Treponema sp.]
MIYFDMDGVLATYDINGYIGEKPPFAQVGGHYFSTLQSDSVAMGMFKTLYKEIPGSVMVLTSVSVPRELRTEQTLDKIHWLLKEFPDFDFGAHFLSTSTEKRNIISNIRGMSLNKRDILIDDWNANLYAWTSNGGTAVKYLNGINSNKSWPGETLSRADGVESCLEKFRRLWFTLNSNR